MSAGFPSRVDKNSCIDGFISFYGTNLSTCSCLFVFMNGQLKDEFNKINQSKTDKAGPI